VIVYALIALYAIGWLVWWRRAVRHEVETRNYRIDWDEVVFGVPAIGLISLSWPVLWAAQAIRSRTTPERFVAAVAGESQAQKLKRLDAERREREAYIEQLEREVGIKP
jgi:hypothetical protein